MSRSGHPRDVEAEAAAYVSGALAARRRRRFERHLIQCERCWGEVGADREGRRLAEAAREVAPASLRDAVRGSVAAAGLSERPRARRPSRPVAVALAAVTAVAVSIGFFAARDRVRPEPSVIAVALDAYERHAVQGFALPKAPDLQVVGLRVVGSERMSLAGTTVEAFAYRGASGATLSLYMADSPFPQATDATPQPLTGTGGWRAERDGMRMLCGNAQPSYLAVSSDAVLMDGLAGAISAGTIVIAV